MSGHKQALDPPAEALSLLTKERLQQALAASRESPRGRIIFPFHRTQHDPLHRMFNAIQPRSYARPHRHLDPPKSEAWIVLLGKLLFVTFDDEGKVRDHHVMSAGSDVFGVDLVPGIYHTVVALKEDTVIYEVKTGPYKQATDKAFAPWAPEEGSPEAASYLSELLARCGQP